MSTDITSLNVQILNEIFNKIKIIKNDIQGIWGVYYNKNSELFKTFGYFLEVKVDDELKENILKSEITNGFGTTSWAYNKFSKNEELKYLLVNNTYNDPRGTVIYLDLQINQKNTIFLPIKIDNEVIGILMVFRKEKIFTYDSAIEITKSINEYENQLKLLIKLSKKKLALDIMSKNYIANANDFDENIINILLSILNLNFRKKLPYIYLKKDDKLENIAFSKKFYTLLENELIYCSLLNQNKENNCHFCKNLHECNNEKSLLKDFFFPIVKVLKVIEQEIEFKYKEVAFTYKISLYTNENDNEFELSLKKFDYNAPDDNPDITSDLEIIKYINEDLWYNINKHLNSEENKYKYILCIIQRKKQSKIFIKNTEDCQREHQYKIFQSHFLYDYYLINNFFEEKEYKKIDDGVKFESIELETEISSNKITSVIWNKKPFTYLLNQHLKKLDDESFDNLLKKFNNFYFGKEKNELKYVKNNIDNTNYDFYIPNNILSEIDKNYLEARKKDFKFLLQQKEIEKQNNRNQNLNIVSYNLSHTYGSHQIPDTHFFLSKIFDILNKTDCNRNIVLKEYYTKQFNRYHSFIADLMLATHTLSEKFSDFYFVNYDIKMLFEELTNYFSSCKDYKIDKENFLGRGINDGVASSCLNLNIDPYQIALPKGELGKTFLIMLISNIFRNLSKHSSSDNFTSFDKSLNHLESIYDNDVEKKENSKKEKVKEFSWRKVFLLKVKKSEPDVEELKKDYLRVIFTEESRDYSKNPIIEKGADGNDVFVPLCNKVKELDEKMNDYSKEDAKTNFGLKEMRTLASALIGMPLEEFTITSDDLDKGFIKDDNGNYFPSKLFEYGVDTFNGKEYLTHTIYLRKSKFANVWVKNKKDINSEIISELDNNGMILKECNDEPDIKSNVEFIIDLNSGRFSKDGKKLSTGKHFNFRYVHFDYDSLCTNDNFNAENFKEKIIENWISNVFCDIKTFQYGNNEIEINNEGRIKVLIDNHFERIKEKPDDWSNFQYIETDSSKGGSRMMDYYKGGNKNQQKDTRYKVHEAVLTDVFIYDEVIQDVKHSFQNNDMDPELDGKKFRETLEKKGIFIKDKSEQDYQKWFSSNNDENLTLEKFKELITLDIETSKFCYVLIHYSGFKKLVEKEGKSSELNKAMIEFSKSFKNSNKYVVFISGKNPSDLPKEVLFANKNSIQNIVQQKNSKYDLVNFLNSLRFKKLNNGK